MSYTKTTDFAAKDALLSGNPAKLIRGTEIDDEFDAIQVADAQNMKTVSSTDNAITRFNGTSGQVQNSGVTIDDSNVMSVPSLVATTADINGGTVDGTVIGGASAAAGTFTSITDSGNLTFTGTGNRITGDFSNATVANRVMFQTSTVNDITYVSAIPNGSGAQAKLRLYNNSTPASGNFFEMGQSGTESSLIATGVSYLPMTFYTGGSERMRIDTSGRVGIGCSPSVPLEVNGTIYARGAAAAGSLLTISPDASSGANGTTISTLNISGGDGPIKFAPGTNLLMTTANGGLGYGTGAGGTVTQATSRTTAVTINKPTGSITMFTAAGSATWAQFYVTNSLVAATDTIVLTANSAISNFYVFTAYAAAGGFFVNFAAVSGTGVDTPKINFAIIKAVTA